MHYFVSNRYEQLNVKNLHESTQSQDIHEDI